MAIPVRHALPGRHLARRASTERFRWGACPSCNGRRMVETAGHLVDHVVPPLPVRQWVLSVPKRLRPFLHHNPAIAGAVLRSFLRAIGTTLRQARPGAGSLSRVRLTEPHQAVVFPRDGLPSSLGFMTSSHSSARAPREAWSRRIHEYHRLRHRSRSRSLYPLSSRSPNPTPSTVSGSGAAGTARSVVGHLRVRSDERLRPRRARTRS